MEQLRIIKIGGNVIDDEPSLDKFLENFSLLTGHKILVHGGGKLATRLAEQLGVPQKLVEGRRVTDAETLKLITMVYAGLVNKSIVAKLQSCNCNAIGLSGADGDSVFSHRRFNTGVDFGFVGDVDGINSSLLANLIQQNLTIVMAPLTHDKKGQLLNTNADTIARELAGGLSDLYEVELIYLLEKNGVLEDIKDENSSIKKLNERSYKELRDQEKIFAGMIPKIDNAFAALEAGVRKVIIGNAEHLQQLIKGEAGTLLVNE
jgi:acetylglutamate kinase